MLKSSRIAVVIPAYNEETQIENVISSMPKFVDFMVIVDDGSTDSTFAKVLKTVNVGPRQPRQLDLGGAKQYSSKNSKVILLKKNNNEGVGAAISLGYTWCLRQKIDCVAVMAGDGQMDPLDLQNICLPVVQKKVDYSKGNRLLYPGAHLLMPKVRYIGIKILSFFTRRISGYKNLHDSQTGYTAISLDALKKIDIQNIYKRYGMPIDMLAKLSLAGCSMREVIIRPVYNVGEKSGMNIIKLVPRICLLLLRLSIIRFSQNLKVNEQDLQPAQDRNKI